jgi:hypothetical protein
VRDTPKPTASDDLLDSVRESRETAYKLGVQKMFNAVYDMLPPVQKDYAVRQLNELLAKSWRDQ